MNKVLSKNQTNHLFDHILDGNEASIEGLRKIRREGLISEEEYYKYLEKAADQLIYKVREFKLREKLFCWTFILLMPYLQIMDMSGDLRRGRRRNECATVVFTEEGEDDDKEGGADAYA